MMRSMFTAVSGLRVHQTKMDVIGNNISNINTPGFKSSRVTFAEVFAQALKGASGANELTGRGGTNPMAIGLGANIASIDLQMVQGAAQRTDNPFDLMIQGDGFFIVGDNSGRYFTRAGAFNFDVDGNLIASNGMKVHGWGREIDEATGKYAVDKYSGVVPLTITEEMRQSAPKSTTNVGFNGNLNPVSGDVHTTTLRFWDTDGFTWETEVTFTFDAEATLQSGYNIWNYNIEPQMHRTEDPDTTIPLNVSGNPYIAFDGNGKLISSPPTSTLEVMGGTVAPVSNFGDGDGLITLDFSNLTQYGETPSNAKSEMKDGHGPGVLQDTSIGPDGVITGRYSNGEIEIFGQISVARFDNPQGLESVGESLFVPTANSGEFDGIGEEVQLSGGKIMAGVLEMSNVDMAKEFTEMIITQRGFQANSRVISTSDDLLQELVNLKR